MRLSLLPPFRVNYNFTDLVCSLFVSEKTTIWRTKCVNYLSHLFQTGNIYLTSSGRSGLYIVLKNLKQSKVFVPAFTCPVVVESIKLAGKEIVYVSTDPCSFNANSFEGIDEDSIVLATHQYGLPCDIQAISRLCKEKSAILIEDCAAALGSKVDDKYVGTFGDYAIFSFNSSKLLTVPSMGGFILAKNGENLQKIKEECSYSNNTLKFKIKHLVRGSVFCLSKNKYLYRIIYSLYIKKGLHLSNPVKKIYDCKAEETYFHPFYEWQARILYKQLMKLPLIMAKNQRIFDYYDANILNSRTIKPVYNSKAVCSRYTIRVENREAFYQSCLKHGIDMDFSFCSLYCPETYRTEIKMAQEIMNVPFYYKIKEKELRYIVNTINSIE